MYQIRKARQEDLPAIEGVYAAARAFMARSGNPYQWGSHHPPREMLVADIREDCLYVVTEQAVIHGVFFFRIGEDPTYARIEDGAWLSPSPYGVIHRIASDGSGEVFPAVLAYCKERISHIRIDTHRDNRVMQHVLEKNGFLPRGTIYVSDGSPRIAYEMA